MEVNTFPICFIKMEEISITLPPSYKDKEEINILVFPTLEMALLKVGEEGWVFVCMMNWRMPLGVSVVVLVWNCQTFQMFPPCLPVSDNDFIKLNRQIINFQICLIQFFSENI